MATYSGNYYLSLAQMSANALYIFKYLSSKGWSKNAICGMLGNIQRESTINPGIWQGLKAGNEALGFGLVQWTPAIKYINWCNDQGLNPSEMDSNLKRILYEVENNIQYIPTDSYPETFKEFTKSTKEVSYLAQAFCYNYERAGVVAIAQRVSNAKYWFNSLTGEKAYTPRLTSEGMLGSKYWYSNTNPFYASGYGLPNCTCYAWGRFWEIGDDGTEATIPHLPTGNASEWFRDVEGYETGSEPQLGAVLCLDGHVAIVEEIYENGDILTSNSAWGGEYFFTKVYTKASGYQDSQSFHGFIYNPFAFSGDGFDVLIPKKKKNYKFILFNKRRSGMYG